MSVLKRVEKLEVALSHTDSELADRTSFLANKLAGLEQVLASMGKTLAALSDELTSTKVLDSKAVLTRLRDVEDNNARNHLSSLLAGGYYEESFLGVVEQDSLVVVGHTLVLPDGTRDVTSNFTIISMLSGAVDPKLKELLLGKQPGESFKGDSDENGHEEFNVIHILKLANKTVTAEDAP